MEIVKRLTEYYTHAFIAEFLLMSLKSGISLGIKIKNEEKISAGAFKVIVENYNFIADIAGNLSIAIFAPVTLPITLLYLVYAIGLTLGAVMSYKS